MSYKGIRLRDGTCRVTLEDKKLDPRHDLFNHSPLGFEWGYGGSGPAQTALAILADHLKNDELAVRLHQRFKSDVIAVLPHQRWSITTKFLRAWLKLQQRLDYVPDE